jgi:hypothetical protein
MSRVKCLLPILLLLSLLLGCSDDCPVCPTDNTDPEPQAYKGWLYYVELRHDLFANLYKVDMETDSIVDTVSYNRSDFGPGAVAVSSDGRYLAIGYTNIGATVHLTRIYDAQSLDFVTEISDAGVPLFANEDHLLIGMHSGHIKMYSVPSFTQVQDIIAHPAVWGQAIDEHNKLVYCFTDDRPLYTYDYANMRIADSIPIVPWPGDTCTIFQFCLNNDYTRIYYRAAAKHGSHVGCYDIESRQVIWTQKTGGFWGTVGVTPDGQDVYVSDYSGDEWESNSIYVYDAESGAFRNGISLYGYTEWPRLELKATSIIFSPTGEKAYVTVISPEMSHGSVMVIDTSLRRIVRVITPSMDRWPQYMAIGPKR